MSHKIVMSPKMPDPILEMARAVLPAGYDLEVVDQSDPKFATAMLDADFFLGFSRGAMGPEFYRSSPRLKLIQLISAGYDRIDLEAARAAKVPVANNNGANSVAVAEHTLMLILAVAKKLVWQHNNVVAGKWRIGDFAADAPVRGGGEDARHRGPRQHRQEGRPPRPGVRHEGAVLRRRPPHRGPGRRPRGTLRPPR